MNEAFLYEKVGAEDQLTSDIFGLLRYLPPELILTPFLQRAECFEDSAEENLAKRIGFSPTKVAFFFWPAAHIPATPNSRSLDRQPDVLMLLRNDSGNSAAVVIEVKYRGTKHDVDARLQREGRDPFARKAGDDEKIEGAEDAEIGGDQLENYLRALLNNEISLRTGAARAATVLSRVVREYANEAARLKEVPLDRRFLLYLTDGDALRQEEKDATMNRFGSPFTLPKSECIRLFWLGWPALYEMVEAKLANLSVGDEAYRHFLEDISRLLDARDLRAFSGWKDIAYEALLADDRHFWRPNWYAELKPFSAEVLARMNFWKRSSE